MKTSKNKNFFSVVIPTYNMLSFLKKAINSVLKQSYKNYEIIIIDNHSSDGTEKYIQSLKNDKIKFFKIKNNGIIGKSRNLGIKKSKGNWIAFLDADDEWLSKKLKDINNFIKKKKFQVICSSELIIDKIQEKKKIWHYGPYEKNFYEILLRYGNKLSTSSSIVNKKFLEKFKINFSEKASFANFEDYDFFLNISRKQGVFFFSKTIHGKHLFHEDSSTLKRKKLKNAFFSVIKHHVKIQRFTKNKDKLFNEISLIYEIKNLLKNIYYKKKVFFSSIKITILFLINPLIFFKLLNEKFKNQKNLIRIN